MENNEVRISHLSRISKKGGYLCDKCSNKGENKILRACGLKKRVNNTTGYIGVIIEKRKGEAVGYISVVKYRHKYVLKNRYKDDSLHQKTLIQAAVDRDLFIIEKGLPHTRNFSNAELKANMLYLGYSQINDIKNGAKVEG